MPTLGRRVLLCTGSDPSRHRALLGDVEPVAVVTVTREPTVDDVRTATEQARAAGADAVVAIGGGSPIDLGKVVAALLGNGTDPLDHLEIVGEGRAARAAVGAVRRGAHDSGHRLGGDRQRPAALSRGGRQDQHP